MIRTLLMVLLLAPVLASAVPIGLAVSNDPYFVMDYQVFPSGRGCIQFGNIVVGRDFPNVYVNGRIERATAFRFFWGAESFNSVSVNSPSVEVPFDPNSRSIPMFRVCGLTPGERVYTSSGLINPRGQLIYFMPIEQSDLNTHSIIVR